MSNRRRLISALLALLGWTSGWLLGTALQEGWPKEMGDIDPVLTGVMLTLGIIFGIVALVMAATDD